MSTQKNYRSIIFNELKKLNREDLRSLCFLLGDVYPSLRYDNLQGEVLDNQIQALIECLEQREAQNSWGELRKVLEEDARFSYIDPTFLKAIDHKQHTSAVDFMREALRTGRRPDVLTAWRLFQERTSGALKNEDALWLESLAAVADKGTWLVILPPAQLRILQKCQQEWPDELVGALLAGGLLATDEALQKTEAVAFLAEIPLTLLRDEALQERFAEARARLLGRLQSRLEKWPVLRPLNLLVSAEKAPFSVFRAEEEYEQLYGRQKLFWPGHALYQLLDGEKTGVHQVIVGEEGCGRTALAQALYAQQRDSGVFTVYVDHVQRLDQIIGELAHHLWQYILHKPLLLPFHKEEYHHLAKVLAVGGIRHGSVAVRQAVRYEQWLDGSQSEVQKKVWRDIGQANLERLQNALAEGNDFYQVADEGAWLVDYAQAIELVCGVAPPAAVRVRVVLDLNEISPELVRDLVANGRAWQRAGLQIFLFVPTPHYRNKLLPWQTHTMVWTESQIERLIGYRLAKFWELPKKITGLLANSEPSSVVHLLRPHIAVDVFNQLVTSSQLIPRRAIELCGALLGASAE